VGDHAGTSHTIEGLRLGSGLVEEASPLWYFASLLLHICYTGNQHAGARPLIEVLGPGSEVRIWSQVRRPFPAVFTKVKASCGGHAGGVGTRMPEGGLRTYSTLAEKTRKGRWGQDLASVTYTSLHILSVERMIANGLSIDWSIVEWRGDT
jgi:hypothetical protein